MAKLAFSKLNLKVNSNINELYINEMPIEVKEYLPMADKMELVSKVIGMAADENNFANPMKIKVFTDIEFIDAYTNLSFTDKQKEDPAKLFDLLESNGVVSAVTTLVEKEYVEVRKYIKECADAIYTYRNSVLGLLESVSQDYSNLNLEASDIQQKLADPANMELLKDVLTKLG